MNVQNEYPQAPNPFWFALVFALLLAIACLTTSCSPRVVYVPQVHDSIQVRTEVRVDSIWRDRVHTEYVKGDTIYKRDSIYIERWRLREVADTVRVCDSIPVVVEVPGPVEYKRTSYDKFCSAAFWIIVAAALLLIAWRIFKRVYLHR